MIFERRSVRGAGRREPRMSFRSAQAARLDGMADPAVLALAADEGRILVSHDFQTMPKYFRQFTQDRRSPGVLLIRQDLDSVWRQAWSRLQSVARHKQY